MMDLSNGQTRFFDFQQVSYGHWGSLELMIRRQPWFYILPEIIVVILNSNFYMQVPPFFHLQRASGVETRYQLLGLVQAVEQAGMAGRPHSLTRVRVAGNRWYTVDNRIARYESHPYPLFAGYPEAATYSRDESI